MNARVKSVTPDEVRGLFVVVYMLHGSDLYATINAKDELDAFKKMEVWMKQREQQP